ncbi:MAG: hypothetical protein H6977_12785 [Gammaproteobacteria bacterium]|nr:hypothetical protein [Gammaproteobacteria bacterium]MCP5200883.1 hypothetical protein [Gammaproteobacteria bacterium]
MQEDNTTPRTVWTETLLELLVAAVQRQQDTEALRILRDIKAKGYRKAAVIRFASRHLNGAEVGRLDKLITVMGKRRSNQG